MKQLFPALALILSLLLFLVSCGAPSDQNPVVNQKPKFVSATPSNGATDVATDTTLSWVFTDPENDPLTYEVRISTDKNNLGEFTKTLQSSYKPALVSSTTYYWEVRSSDGKNTTSSGILSFSTVIGPPKKPELLAPVNGMQKVDHRSVDFYWRCTDPDPRIVFELYLDGQKKVETSRTNYTLYNLEPGKEYEWYVVAKNRAGTNQSDKFKFTTAMAENRSPTVPIVVSPPDGAQSVGIPVTLEWRCEDPDQDPLQFDVYLNNQMVTQNLSVTTFLLTDLIPNTTYKWFVFARDGNNDPVKSPEWTFTTKGIPNRPPEKPYDPSPQPGRVLNETDVVLTWNCSDPDGDKLFYDLYFGESSNPPLVRENIETNSAFIQNLQIGRKYYWKVVAKDGSDETEGDLWYFFVLPPSGGSKLLVLTQNGTYHLDALNVSSPTIQKIMDETGQSIYCYDQNIYVLGEKLIIKTNDATAVNEQFSGNKIIVSELEPILRIVAGELYACISDGSTMKILNVRDPYNVYEVSSITGQNINSIFVQDSKVYLCDENKLRIIEAVIPGNPEIVGEYTLDSALGQAVDVFVVGETAYLVSENRLLKLDLSNPSAVTKEREFDLEGTARRVYYDSGFVFALTSEKLYKLDDAFQSVISTNLENGTVLLVRSGYIYLGTINQVRIMDLNLELIKDVDTSTVIDMCFF